MHHNPNQNRGFLYGDGFFETMRVVNFTIPLWDLHMERAKRTAEYLEMDWLTGAEIEALRVQIGYGVVSESSILRVDFYRDGTGTYVPDQNNIKTSFDFRPAYFPNASFTLYKQEFEAALNLLPVTPAAIYSKVLKPCNTMSNCKTSSALWYVKAGLHLRSVPHIEDLILLNEHNRVCEGLTSNVLIQKNKKWYGVAQEEGPIEGVYQRFLSDLIEINFGTITTQQLRNADCILLTNAALGIRKVELVG